MTARPHWALLCCRPVRMQRTVSHRLVAFEIWAPSAQQPNIGVVPARRSGLSRLIFVLEAVSFTGWQIRQEQPKEQVKRLAVVETYPPLLGLQPSTCGNVTCPHAEILTAG